MPALDSRVGSRRGSAAPAGDATLGPMGGSSDTFGRYYGPVDVALASILLGSFAVLVTLHVALSLALVRRGPWWRGALCLIFPPLAPWWGIEAGFRKQGLAWAAALTVYGVACALAWL